MLHSHAISQPVYIFPKIAVLFAGSFQAVLFFFFFVDLCRNKLAETHFFCLSQQKKRTTRKELLKRITIGACKPAIYLQKL